MSDPLAVKQIPSPKQLCMTPQVFAAICETIGTRHAETGGILGGNRQTGEVTHFFFDERPSEKTRVLYVPNNSVLNDVRKKQWKPQGIDYLGSIHSHPPGFRHPSRGDEDYAGRILEVLEVPYLLTPIVMTVPDTGSFSLYPFVATLHDGGVTIVEQELFVGGNLIRPSKPVMPDKTGDAEEYLANLIELQLNMAAIWYDSMPWNGHRHSRHVRNGGLTDDYD